jgi:hypothetical protein
MQPGALESKNGENQISQENLRKTESSTSRNKNAKQQQSFLEKANADKALVDEEQMRIQSLATEKIFKRAFK